jgi:hypothetical protein
MGKKKFIDKKNAKHFYLVHRPHTDPLRTEDNEYVLQEVGGSYAEEEIVHQSAPGDAAQYGLFFPDQNEYDYMQHLKEMGRDSKAVWVASKSELNNVVNINEEQRDGNIVPDDDTEVCEIMDALNDDAYINEFDDSYIESIIKE